MIGTLYGEGGAMSQYASFSLLLAELMIGTKVKVNEGVAQLPCFSLLLAELMIGTTGKHFGLTQVSEFQSPISGVNDWNTML